MATTKTFNNVRLKLKYDSINAWTTNNPVLYKGEIAFTTVQAADGDVKQAPSVLMKVGDGTTHYNDLKFVSGLAANVHSWALAENKPTYAASEITDLATFVTDKNTTYKVVKVDDYNYKLQSKNFNGEWTDVADSAIVIPKYDDTQVKADIDALKTKVGSSTVAEQVEAALNSAKAYTDALKNGEVANNTAAIAGIKNGDTLESFADVESKFNADLININAAKNAAEAAQADVDALETKVGTVATGKTVVQMIEEAQTAATYDDTQVKADIQANTTAIDAIEADYLKSADKTELADDITAVETKVNTLIGTDADKSVRTIANEELAAQLIPENAAESLDTLQEIAAWIQSHPNDASAMNTAISALETKVGDETVNKQITDAIDALKAGDIKGAVDRITALEANTHTHDNKTVLDGITSEKVSDWDAAKTGMDDLTTKVGTVATGKTVVQMIEEAQTAATYDDTQVKADIQANTTAIDGVKERTEVLETKAVLEGDTLILDCGNSTIA